MDKSKFLAKTIGIYLIIISIAMLVNAKSMPHILYGFISSPALLFTAGMLTVILGILLVLSHNIWHRNWKVIITLIAWLVLVKGITILIFPQLINDITLSFVQNHYFYYIGCGFDFLLGIYLSYLGFRR